MGVFSWKKGSYLGRGIFCRSLASRKSPLGTRDLVAFAILSFKNLSETRFFVWCVLFLLYNGHSSHRRIASTRLCKTRSKNVPLFICHSQFEPGTGAGVPQHWSLRITWGDVFSPF